MANFKALITTLVLGSSAIAAADPCAPAPAPVYTQPQAPVYSPPIYQAPAPAPVYRPVVLPAQQPPAWRPYFNITNTTVAPLASTYRGWLATSPVQMQRTSYYGRVVLRPTRTASWFDLTEATRIDSGREIFNIGADNGWFSQLKLDGLGNARGSSISKVVIRFADATGAKAQVVTLNRKLDAAHPSITIDLDGTYRQIASVQVYGSTTLGSAFKIAAK